MRRPIGAVQALLAATLGGLVTALALGAGGFAGGGAPALAGGGERDLAALYRQAMPAVASVSVGERGGSAFLADDNGHLVTNAHVVGDARAVEVILGGETTRAEVVGVEPSVDVAVLALPGGAAGARPLPLEREDRLAVGDPVVAIGAPFGLSGSLSLGIVSGLRRQIDAPNGFAITGVIQTDAALNPGNSGGPLLDLSGRVVGVATQIATEGGRNEGIGFAVPAATVARVVDQIIATGRAELAYLGIVGQDAGDGILVAGTTDAGPAAGILRAGDLLTGVDGRPIRGNGDLGAVLAELAPGARVEVELVRGGDAVSVEVTLAARAPEGP